MAVHVIYRTIVRAIKADKLMEPFSLNDLIKACPYLNKYTCMVFLSKHRQDNPSETSQLFEMDPDGKFKLIRPLQYDL
ncbi:hypothetical protein [Candidatus Nitrosotalea bavarica]|jgi:hypothetical protein|uniref:hypothetical protein n=1 Tax=Candidatus Nitrosotalea bavarica TaxID=1903277 RepID=UPI000C70DE48|nr:hypothetical protein [Candidatus Nitrosotalea bavarica]